MAGVPNFSLNFLRELLSEKPEKNVVTKTDNLFVQKQTVPMLREKPVSG